MPNYNKEFFVELASEYVLNTATDDLLANWHKHILFFSLSPKAPGGNH